MLDFVLGLIFAVLLVRGWMRGLVREVLDLVGLVAGAGLAFLLSAPVGRFLTERFGFSPEGARIGAGIGLFLLFGVALGVVAHLLSKVMRLPGLSTVNRVGGAGVSMLWGVALVLLLVAAVRVLPVPESWREALDDSAVVQIVAGPESVPWAALTGLTGDGYLSSLISIRDVFGSTRAVPEQGETLEFPPAEPDEIRQVRDEATALLVEVNRYRAGRGLTALRESRAITRVAEARAGSLYTSGVLRLATDCRDLLRQGDVLVTRCADAVALAVSAPAGFHGIRASENGELALSTPDLDRAGIAVVDGPNGTLVVLLLGG